MNQEPKPTKKLHAKGKIRIRDLKPEKNAKGGGKTGDWTADLKPNKPTDF